MGHGWRHKGTRQERGYGRDHELMRKRVLDEEPFCRLCTEAGRTSLATIADHIIPKAEGGTDNRENYQGLCKPCSDAKTAEEAARAQGRAPPRKRVAIGVDGWPEG